MNKRILKLVNDERKSLVIRSAKGCTGSAQDKCDYKDLYDGCTAYDRCYYDAYPCGGASNDYCNYDTN